MLEETEVSFWAGEGGGALVVHTRKLVVICTQCVCVCARTVFVAPNPTLSPPREMTPAV